MKSQDLKLKGIWWCDAIQIKMCFIFSFCCDFRENIKMLQNICWLFDEKEKTIWLISHQLENLILEFVNEPKNSKNVKIIKILTSL